MMALILLICLVGCFTGFPAQLFSDRYRPLRKYEPDPDDAHYEGPFR